MSSNTLEIGSNTEGFYETWIKPPIVDVTKGIRRASSDLLSGTVEIASDGIQETLRGVGYVGAHTVKGTIVGIWDGIRRAFTGEKFKD